MKYTSHFLACSLAFCSGVVADTTQESAQQNHFRQGDKLPKEQYHAGYNAPGEINVEKSWSPQIFSNLSFLYYYATQGGMDLADSAALTLDRLGVNYEIVSVTNSRCLVQDYAFKPGFKVGLGAGYNDSFLSANYTWIRQTTHTSKNAPTPSPNLGEGVWILNNWFQQLSPASQTMATNHISSTWHLGVDIGDLLLSHAFYQGTALIAKPFIGLRGAWIRQRIKVGLDVLPNVIANPTSPTIYSKNFSNSWAIGPRVGLDASYLLGMGIRFEGSMAASILVTQYTKVRHREDVASASTVPSVLGAKISKYNSLRPEADLSLGLGWGRYLHKGRYHFDLSANYDFLIFFEQNMIRKLLDQTISGVSPAVSNLYFQGLNISARFDF